MHDIAPALAEWIDRGERFAVCTIVSTSGSSPRPIGTSMAVHESGEVIGSLSGGCVEGAVYEAARQVLGGAADRIEEFGYGDDSAFAVGLTCGGSLTVLVADATGDAAIAAAVAAITRNQPMLLATLMPAGTQGVRRLTITADGSDGSLGAPALDSTVTVDGRAHMACGGTTFRTYGPQGERLADDYSVLLQAFTPPPRMLVFGAIDFAAAMTRIGALLGYHVTVCDARAVFATPKRFPAADAVVCEWPHVYLAQTEVDQRTAICVLTHDPKFDVPLLQVALRSPAGYIGAMGSRRTHAERLERLREAGITESELARLRSPIGLDLGGRTPEETAVSIAAEIVRDRCGGTGQALSSIDAPIHAGAQS